MADDPSTARDLHTVAAETLECAMAWHRDAKLIGNVSARELAELAYAMIVAWNEPIARTYADGERDATATIIAWVAEVAGSMPASLTQIVGALKRGEHKLPLRPGRPFRFEVSAQASDDEEPTDG